MLRERFVEKGTRLFAKHDVLRVTRDADHLPEITLRAHLEPPAQRILAGPQAFGHRCVDDRDLRRGFAVELAEAAALQYAVSHSGQVFGSDIVSMHCRETVLIARCFLGSVQRYLEVVA